MKFARVRPENRPWVVVAPDKLKGSCSAAEAAAAIVAGLREVWGDRAEYRAIPMADGGEGTVEAFLDGGACARRVTVHGPLGDPVEATYALLDGIAVAEMAAASGLGLIGARRKPLVATTYGTGEVMRDALDAGARRIVLGIGGSATTDGGAGALAALGARFYDAEGEALEPRPEALERLARLDLDALDPRLSAVEIDVACDVDNPLLGARGAAAVYGPQKGAGPEAVARLDGILRRLADVAVAATGRDLRDLAGAGAAGGLGWGLATCLGARLSRGFALVAELRGLRAALDGAVLCVTAEGRIDTQTLAGKVVAGVATLCAELAVPVVALAGDVDPATERALGARGVTCLPLPMGPLTLEEALRSAPALIRAAAARLARLRRPQAP